MPRRASVTTALLGVALLLTAGLFDAEPLYVPAVGLLLLAGAAELIVLLGARRAQIRRVLSSGRVLEGEWLSVRWEARTGLGPLAAGTVHDRATELDPVVRIPAGRRIGRRQHPLTFPRRGRVRLPAPHLMVADPLGLAQRCVTGSSEDSVLVLPRPYPVRAPMHRGNADAGADLHLLAGAATEPDGLRPLQAGTPASRIFWPALARGGDLIERRLLPEADSLPMVIVDSHRPDSEEALDAAVRAATSLALELGKTGGCALLLPGDRRATVLRGLAGWPALHARLALVAPGPPPRVAEAGTRAPAIVWVRGRVDPRIPPRATLLVQPGELPNRRPVFSVAGCHGYLVANVVRKAVVA